MPSFQVHEQEVIKEENSDLLLPAVKESKMKAFNRVVVSLLDNYYLGNDMTLYYRVLQSCPGSTRQEDPGKD